MKQITKGKRIAAILIDRTTGRSRVLPNGELVDNILASAEARQASRFLNADDRLSRAASAKLQWQRAQDEIAEDLRAFHAPGECSALAFQGEDLRLRRLLAAQGFTEAEFDAALDRRCSAKFAWQAGL